MIHNIKKAKDPEPAEQVAEEDPDELENSADSTSEVEAKLEKLK